MASLLCCGSCLRGLVAAGGVRVMGRVASMLDRCEPHPGGGKDVHAMHCVEIDPAAVEVWKKQEDTLPSPIADPSDRALVATLATMLLAANASMQTFEAVRLARVVLAEAEKT